MQFPSQFLPSLVPFPSFRTLSDSLDRLAVPPAVNDLRIARYVDFEHTASPIAAEECGTVEEEAGDAFELRFKFSWLERLIVNSTKELAKGDEGETEWVEEVMEKASSLLANLSGEGSTGEVTQVFRLPFDPISPTKTGDQESYIDIRIRDTTLIGHSTGHRTWGAAPLLSQLVAKNADHFFPIDSAPPGSTLRVLELGAGTGLVGVVAARLLEASGRQYSMKLTDWQPIILDNLRHNLALNNLDSRTTVEQVDWSTYLDRIVPINSENRFDIILGADIVYDLTHIALLHATVTCLLAWPTPTTQSAFHLALPARSTHSKETEVFDSAFPRPQVTTSVEFKGIRDEDGKEWRLVSRSRREMVGEDGFQNKASRYIVYEIIWQALEDIALAVSDA